MKGIRYRILFLLLVFSSLGLYCQADPKHLIPVPAIAAMAIGAILLGLMISTAVSFLIRYILQRLRREKRGPLWPMVIITFIFPAIYVWGEDVYHWLYFIDAKYGYEIRSDVYVILLFIITIIASVFGYFITPKKD